MISKIAVFNIDDGLGGGCEMVSRKIVEYLYGRYDKGDKS